MQYKFALILSSPVLVLLACGASVRKGGASGEAAALVFRESFDDLAKIQADWVVATPDTPSANARVADGTIHLSIGTGVESEFALRHRVDIAKLRGKRVRVSARVRTKIPTRAQAQIKMTVTPHHGQSSYSDMASSRSVYSETWLGVDTVIDLDQRATTADIALTLRGGGDAWFDDVEVTTIGDVPEASTRLSRQQVEGLVALAKASAQIRYLHPADQANQLDWDGFLAAAAQRVLTAGDRSSLLATLSKVFGEVAPTVTFSIGRPSSPLPTLPRGTATHLARWRHSGLGTTAPYLSYLEGRASEGDLSGIRTTRASIPDLGQCKRAQLDIKFQRYGQGAVNVYMKFERAERDSSIVTREVSAGMRELSFAQDVPVSTRNILVGFEISGRAGLTTESLSITCESGGRFSIDLRGDWQSIGASHLYDWTLKECNSQPCATFERRALDTEFMPERDISVVDVGSGLYMRMPLAVWADSKQTYPSGTLVTSPRSFTIRDQPARLAAVLSAWGTLSLFYPYFKDQSIAWDEALRVALNSAAEAKLPSETHEILARMTARLQDNHVRVMHPAAPIDGVLPVALRRFGDRLIVVGVLPEYASAAPIGAEVIALDGIPAIEGYDRMHQRVSAGTAGWHEFITSFFLTVGRSGGFRRLKVRSIDGKETEQLLPLLPRDLYDAVVREPRPKNGSEVAPGVFYVDFEALKADTWKGLKSTLKGARAILFDLRGYVTNVGFDALASLTDRELPSPLFQTPLIGSGSSTQYLLARWSLRPALARLTAPVVVLIDGRSGSAVETMGQIIRENKLATFVGENSAGNNGNTCTFDVPGGFSIRFTGMRVTGPNGDTIQGHGITPDKVVHPTLLGVRNGRDEILEAGVATAQQLAATK